LLYKAILYQNILSIKEQEEKEKEALILQLQEAKSHPVNLDDAIEKELFFWLLQY